MPAPHEPQPWALAKLSKYAARTVEMLHDLTDDRVMEEQHGVMHGAQDEVVSVGVMPKTAVAHSDALAFIFRRKAGALLSYGHERCLVVAKLTGHDGREAGWSAPLFCSGRTLGLGLSAGWMEMRVCWAIEGQGNLRDLLQPQSLAGVNAAFLVDMNGAQMRPLRSVAGSRISAAKDGLVAKYYTTDAFMVDLAVRAGFFRQDLRLNRALYGPDATPQDILGGRVPCPPEFLQVHLLLAQLQLAAGPVPGAGLPRISSKPRHVTIAGQERASASRPGSSPPSRPPSKQDSGSERSRSVFAGSTAAGQPSPPPALHGSGDDASPPVPAQNGEVSGDPALSAPDSPQPQMARSTSPGRPPRHPRSHSPRPPFGSSPQPPRSDSPQAAALGVATEGLAAGKQSPSRGSNHSRRSADSRPHTPDSGVSAE
ncbi:hypothetical protein ABPG77_010017 [Micractinium sp. CCAP 211/92]